MSGTHDACGMMHVQADIAFGGKLGSPVCRPMRTRTITLSGQTWVARARCISTAAETASVARAKATKKASPCVSTSWPFHTRNARTEELAALLQHTGVTLAQLLEQRGGALDIRKEECDGPRRELKHTEPPCRQSECAHPQYSMRNSSIAVSRSSSQVYHGLSFS